MVVIRMLCAFNYHNPILRVLMHSFGVISMDRHEYRHVYAMNLHSVLGHESPPDDMEVAPTWMSVRVNIRGYTPAAIS